MQAKKNILRVKRAFKLPVTVDTLPFIFTQSGLLDRKRNQLNACHDDEISYLKKTCRRSTGIFHKIANVSRLLREMVPTEENVQSVAIVWRKTS